MRKLLPTLFALTSLGLLSAPAAAADLGAHPYTKAPPRVAPFNTWTGFYVGVHLGGGWEHIDYSGTSNGTSGGAPFATTTIGSASGGTASRDLSGILGGGQFGFNYEFVPHWVIGVEADVSAADLHGSNTNCSFSSGVLTGCSHAESTVDALGTIRGRIGYAFDNVLLYGTGGFGWDHSKGTSQPFCSGAGCPGVSAFPVVAGVVSTSQTAYGWVAGAGAEWRLLPNWSARLEYLHMQFDNVATTGSGTETIGATPVVYTFATSANAGIDVVRVGVSYLFH